MALRVRNWEIWQTYRKDRSTPPWIKLHRRIQCDPDWVGLTAAQRGELVCIWMLAADRVGEIPDDPTLIRRLCHLKHNPDLKFFIRKGFLAQVDANVTPFRRQGGVKDESA
jgi:hypothetical protein